MLHSIQSWVVSHLVTPTCISTGVTSLTSDCLKVTPWVPRKQDSYSKLIEKNLKVLKGIGLKSYLVSMVIFPPIFKYHITTKLCRLTSFGFCTSLTASKKYSFFALNFS